MPPPDNAAELRRIIDLAEDVSPDYQSEVSRLAALAAHEYDRCRKSEASRLGVRVGTLDADVRCARGATGAADGGGEDRSLRVTEVEPWPCPVNGAILLDELTQTVRRYVVLDRAAADAMALWLMHTHAIDAAFVSPRLAITSPEKRCGKTLLMTVLRPLARRPLATANMTTATIFRIIQAAHPTLLIDEADSFLKGNEEMRGVINAGHCRATAIVMRCVETPRSPDGYEVRPFDTFGPMAIAAIGRMPGTIEDRAIKIAMRRRRPDESVERLRLDRLGELLKPLARGAARWVADHADELATADPEMPAGLHDRAADNWRPLLAIADAAGGEWPERARSAAVILTRDGADDAETVRTMLLTDLRDMFAREPSGVLFTSEILEHLHGRDDRPRPEYRDGQPITARQVAALLRPLKITTNQTVRRGATTGKGYRAADLADAWSRYLPPAPSVTRSHAANSAAFSGNGSVTLDPAVTDRVDENLGISAGCDRVTDKKEGTAANEECEGDQWEEEL
jgi:putative DNA primase/helicase